jgi:hypothetical protein
VAAGVSLNAVCQSGEPISASTARPTCRTRRQAAANRSAHANLSGSTLTVLQLAGRLGGGTPRDDDPLASGGLEIVLAPEVSTRPTADSQANIRRMGRENPSWGEERIANELLLKLGIQVSPRTVRNYPTEHHEFH